MEEGGTDPPCPSLPSPSFFSVELVLHGCLLLWRTPTTPSSSSVALLFLPFCSSAFCDFFLNARFRFPRKLQGHYLLLPYRHFLRRRDWRFFCWDRHLLRRLRPFVLGTSPASPANGFPVTLGKASSTLREWRSEKYGIVETSGWLAGRGLFGPAW